MKKAIAVQGFSHQISDPTVQAVVVLTGIPETGLRAGGAGVCMDGFGATVSAITVPSAGATIPDPGPYNVQFNKSTTKTKYQTNGPLRVDDETGTINATPKIPGSPPVSFPVSFKLQITNAGQSKVRAE